MNFFRKMLPLQLKKPVQISLNNHQRIESIDALRAFALFGILLVHISQLYNFDNEFNTFPWFTEAGLTIKRLISIFLSGRCRIIFSILFGVSFYLILRNPTYSIYRFCWRCILLMGFGLFDLLFFSTDILWWYGLNGIILSILPIRKLPTNYILVLAIILYAFSLTPFSDFGVFTYPDTNYNNRYHISMNFFEYITYSYTNIFKEQLHVFCGNGTQTIAFFTFGYYLGKQRIIDKIDDYSTFKNICIALAICLLFRFYYQFSNYSIISRRLSELAGALFYSLFFVYLFNKQKTRLLPLTNYGRLGLTNYSTQNVLWPIILLGILFPLRFSFEYIFMCALVFYCLQVYFAYWWTNNYIFGPVEYIWRIATQLKFISNKRNRQ